MFRNLRTFLSVGRLPLRTENHLSRRPLQYNVRRVRIVRPIFSRQRFFRAALYTTPFLGFWFLVLPAFLPEVSLEEDGWQDVDGHGPLVAGEGESGYEASHASADQRQEKGGQGVRPSMTHQEQADRWPGTFAMEVEEEEIDEDETFIPLGWVQETPVQPYKGTDPEWQEFIKFSRDRDRGAKVRLELAHMVEAISASKESSRRVCGSPMRVTKYWLDFDYPSAPPPEFWRSGIAITDEYVAWTSRPVTSRDYFRVRQGLWPSAMASSLWTSGNALVQHKIGKLKEALGVKPESTGPRPPLPVPPFPMLPRSNAGSSPAKPASMSDQRPSSEAPVTAADTAASPKARPPPPSSSPSSRSDLLPPLPSVPRPSESMDVALTAFRRHLAQSWRPSGQYPPRGTIKVSGLVEVLGPKAMVVFDVQAAYDPRTSTWEGLGLAVRRVQPLKQAPVG